MSPEAVEPIGYALLDYLNGITDAEIIFHRDDGRQGVVPARQFFRTEFNAIEQTALDLCRGRVLDTGAGAGCHSLALQERGVEVCAIDVSPEAVEVMHQRGVRKAYCVDLNTFQSSPFDTVLMLMNGIGLVEDLAGLDSFLRQAQRLLTPNGQILVDSTDYRRSDNPSYLPYIQANLSAGRYFGECFWQAEYGPWAGVRFGWLDVDEKTLAEHAARAGWQCEILLQEELGPYLARLTRDAGGDH